MSTASQLRTTLDNYGPMASGDSASDLRSATSFIFNNHLFCSLSSVVTIYHLGPELDDQTWVAMALRDSRLPCRINHREGVNVKRLCKPVFMRSCARLLAVRPCFTLPVMTLHWAHFRGSTKTCSWQRRLLLS